MDFTERLELYQEGGMITATEAQAILRIADMFREKYGIVLCEENAGTFIAHLCAAYARIRTGEPVEPLMPEVFEEVQEMPTYERSLEMLDNVEAMMGVSLAQEERPYLLVHINSVLEKLPEE